MNTNWLTLSKERRIELLNQTTELTGLPAIAIEKDWAVTREDEHKIEPRQLIRAIPNKGFSCKQIAINEN